jgi:hypothetical protein
MVTFTHIAVKGKQKGRTALLGSLTEMANQHSLARRQSKKRKVVQDSKFIKTPQSVLHESESR